MQAISFQEIEQRYGPAVRRIVEGETKFSKIGNIEGGCSKADLKALDLQQLFLAMTEEVRIIVVKLADRLHNMRTLGSMPPEKQQKIAAETLQVTLRGPPPPPPLPLLQQPFPQRCMRVHVRKNIEW